MFKLSHAPLVVYVLRVGRKDYFEPGDAGGHSTLRLFLTAEACVRYKRTVEPFLGSALEVASYLLEEAWREFTELDRVSQLHFNERLRVVVAHVGADNVVQDFDVLWDATATQH
jgi:hypothetical protein